MGTVMNLFWMDLIYRIKEDHNGGLNCICECCVWSRDTQVILSGNQILIQNLVCVVFIKECHWNQYLLKEEERSWGGQRENLKSNANPMAAWVDPVKTFVATTAHQSSYMQPKYWAFYTTN